jgi:copper resistance protein B
MSRLLLLLAASALATSPAVAQHSGPDPHAGHQMPAKKPAAKKPVAKKPVAKKPVAKKPAPKKPTPKKSAKKSAPKKRLAKKAAQEKKAPEKAPAREAADPHAGHVMPPEQSGVTDTRAGHDMTATPVDPPVGPPPPEALSGPQNAADTIWGRTGMDAARAVLQREHGDMPAYKLLIDQVETRVRNGRDGYFVNAEGWYGSDIDKLWLKTEIEGEYGHKPEQAELQTLWSHAVDPWFDLQAGVRLDAQPDRRAHLVVGLQGLAPYWIEVDAAAFLSDQGDVTARVEAEHDLRVTRKLILQPRAELDLALQDVPRQKIGSGLSAAELGVRLRYQIVPQFAPYVGLNYERAFGDTRRFRRADGDDAGGWSLVTGLRAWF